MPIHNTLLKRASDRLGVAASALADAGNVKIPTVYTHLSGKSQPAVTVAVGYCELLQRINAAYPATQRPFKPSDLTPEALFGKPKRRVA